MLTAQQLPILVAAWMRPLSTVVSWSPSTLFSSWSEDGNNITVPIASWPGLTADTADAVTGDARKVIVGFQQQAFAWYNALENKPESVTVEYVPGRFQTFGAFSGKQKVEFKITAYLTYPSGVLADEA